MTYMYVVIPLSQIPSVLYSGVPTSAPGWNTKASVIKFMSFPLKTFTSEYKAYTERIAQLSSKS